MKLETAVWSIVLWSEAHVAKRDPDWYAVIQSV